MKKRIVVVCPGRGSYTKETLGYLRRFRPQINGFVEELDGYRRERGEPTITELDEMSTFQPAVHTKGENASTLIYACAMADFLSIDPEKYEIVAVVGNSMGWYITLACAGALNTYSAFSIINTMGSMMKERIIGGQIIYPIINEKWVVDRERIAVVEQKMNEAREFGQIYTSIFLGGYRVIAGDPSALNHLMKTLPKQENYPFQLVNHAAFHTPLLQETSEKAFQLLGVDLFQKPQLPMVDGRGHIWQPYSTDLYELYQYTLDHQVVKPYDFTASVTVALKEFAPDQIFLLGPGNSLGGSIGQVLVQNRWQNISDKLSFQERQKQDPFLVSMGMK